MFVLGTVSDCSVTFKKPALAASAIDGNACLAWFSDRFKADFSVSWLLLPKENPFVFDDAEVNENPLDDVAVDDGAPNENPLDDEVVGAKPSDSLLADEVLGAKPSDSLLAEAVANENPLDDVVVDGAKANENSPNGLLVEAEPKENPFDDDVVVDEELKANPSDGLLVEVVANEKPLDDVVVADVTNENPLDDAVVVDGLVDTTPFDGFIDGPKVNPLDVEEVADEVANENPPELVLDESVAKENPATGLTLLVSVEKLNPVISLVLLKDPPNVFGAEVLPGFFVQHATHSSLLFSLLIIQVGHSHWSELFPKFIFSVLMGIFFKVFIGLTSAVVDGNFPGFDSPHAIHFEQLSLFGIIHIGQLQVLLSC